MNPLRELLDARVWPSLADLRDATEASLYALKHDRRVSALDLDETRDLTTELYNEPDIRTLSSFTTDVDPKILRRDVANAEAFSGKLLIEVIDSSTHQYPGVMRLQTLLVQRGSQVRLAAVPFRAIVYNRERALVARDFDDNLAGAYLVEEPSLVEALLSLHARLWRGGSRWTPAATRSRSAPVDLFDVMRELLSGATDEAAAAHLGISLRTYRRRVQELLRLLGTQSRFQAGAFAQERKYLDLVRPPDWAATT